MKTITNSRVRIVIAADKFKGSLSAADVTTHLTTGLRRGDPTLDLATIPVADGGDGTLDAAIAAGFRRIPVTATGPTGRPVPAAIAVRGTTAVIELAAASGLSLLPDHRPDPTGATSRGTGDLIRAALDAGCHEILLGVGGSATTDAGAGMLCALGARLYDQQGHLLPDGGAALTDLARIDLDGLDPRLRATRVILASDVDNPLLGTHGAAAVYAPQKGASPADVALLDRALRRWSELIDPAATSHPGAGAAGGVGYTAMSVLAATRRPGIDVVLDLGRFAEALPGASLVITGEGRLDTQTLRGKAPAGIAARAAALGIPTVAVCGQCTLRDAELAEAMISRAYALTDIEPDVDVCLASPGPILEQLATHLVADLLASP